MDYEIDYEIDYGDDLPRQVRDQLGDEAEKLYNVSGIVQDIRDRYGDVITLDWIDSDTLHAIYSANER